MITYIAIYAGIGLVVAAYRLICLREIRDITLDELLLEIICCATMWPLAVIYGACLFVVDRLGCVEKLLNKVVIKRKK